MATDTKLLASQQIAELLSKALLDEELRERLFTDTARVAREFNLPCGEAQAIRSIDRRKFEQAAARLRWS